MNTPGKIGAFFDLDGTLLAPPSLEWRFIGYLLERDEIRTKTWRDWVAAVGEGSAEWLGECGVFANKHYLAGIHESFVGGVGEHDYAWNRFRWFAEGIDHVRRHLERGHRVMLVTGTLAPLARAITGHLPRGVEVRATNLEVRDECFTGKISGQHVGFEEKARVMHE